MFEFHLCVEPLYHVFLAHLSESARKTCSATSGGAVLLEEDHDDEKLRVLLVPEECAASSSPLSPASTVSPLPG